MKPWQHIPLVRFLLPLLAGILWAICRNDFSLTAALNGLSAGALVFVSALALRQRVRLAYNWLVGMALMLTAFFAGLAVTINARLDLRPAFFEKTYKEGAPVLLQLTENLTEKDAYYKGVAEVQATMGNTGWQAAEGKVLLYLFKKNISSVPSYGDVLLVRGKLNRLQPPRNPGEFDLQRYMSYRQVWHSAYLQAADWQSTGYNTGSAVYRAILSFKNRLVGYLDEMIPEKEENGFLKALVLGDVSELSPYVTSSYAGTGTMHVLSVSGLHVGALMMLAGWLLFFLKWNRPGRIMLFIISLIFLWGYALLTGMSPSVVRSAAMFSFVLIGINLRRQTSTYHSICASAIIILLFDPFVIMQAGFQLSYLALLGIVWLNNWLQQYWTAKRKAVILLRDALTMSVSAQLATFPIGLLYFSQFPSYFLIANIVVIPFGFLLLYSGCIVLLLRLTGLKIVASVLAKGLYYLVKLLNATVALISRLPGASMEGIYLTPLECLLLYLSLFLILLAFMYRKKYSLALGLMIAIALAGMRGYRRYETSQLTEVRIHAIPKSCVISVREGDSLFLIADSSFLRNESQVKYYIRTYAFSRFVPRNHIIPLAWNDTARLNAASFARAGSLSWFSGHSIFMIRSKEDLHRIQASALPRNTYLVLSGNPRLHISELPAYHSIRHVLFAPDNSRHRCEQWERECKECGMSYTNLQKDNSFALVQQIDIRE